MIKKRAAQSAPPAFFIGHLFRELCDALNHHVFDLGDRFSWVQPFRTNLSTVHDRVAAIELERVFQLVQPLARRLVPAVDQPAIGMQKGSGPKIPVTVPPV